MANIRKRFGERIAGLRDERNWTQEDLAAASGVSARSISSIENGVYSVTLDTAYKLARGFGVPLSRLFDIK
ncbi:MAG TPA: helix-turn-helix transcriptional regulator [Gammaproteobacteria bacterium]